MYNLLISGAVALACFGLGWGVTGTLVAGFVPALLGAIAAYLVLVRRTGKQIEEIMGRAQKEIERAQTEANPKRLESARKIMCEGFALGRWQVLLDSQIHASVGMLDYQLGFIGDKQKHWKDAREHLDKAWSRAWQAKAVLAAMDHRDGDNKKAMERLEAVAGPAKKDATFWGLYAWLALQEKDRDKALAILNRGLQALPESKALQGMADQVRNAKKVKMKPFAPGWYQYFPEQMQRQVQRHGGVGNQGGYSYPQPRR